MADDLLAENEALKAELAMLRSQRAAEQGPPAGTEIHYQRGAEPHCRPAVIVSDGFSEVLTTETGMVTRHALVEYYEHESVKIEAKDGTLYTPKHGFQVDRAWHPLGAPDTWHMPDECPRAPQAS